MITCRIQVGGGKAETMKYITEIASAFIDGIKKVPNLPVRQTSTGRYFTFDQQYTTVLNKRICGPKPKTVIVSTSEFDLVQCSAKGVKIVQ